ncbi:MAG: chromosomal replication initiator protein DnaA [Geobacteraceae bacterium]|nr:chromosomal replication initiator protein DnaA [Geobacteraceae bacterium]
MKQIWNDALLKIEHIISPLAYNSWIRPLKFIDSYGSSFIIEVPSEFHKNEVKSRYISLIREVVSGVANDTYEIELKVAESSTDNSPDSYNEIQASTETIQKEKVIVPRSPSSLNTRYTFDSFVCGTSNEFAYAASQAVAETPANRYNPLFIYGGTGLGKTHLMVAIGNQILSENPVAKICYYTSETFMNEMINCIRHKKMEEFRSKFRKADVLLIDDIQFMAGREATEVEFFHTFNALYESHKQIVITSDKFPKEIPGLEERLRSRFEWGLIADIQPPDVETKVAILKKKAEVNKIDLPDDVAFLIGSSNASNIREIEGMLIRIGAYASLTKNKINLLMAKDILKDIIVDKNREISIESIQKHVADHFKLKVADLKSEKRLKSFVIPRQIAIYLSRELTKASFPEIGEKFGGKDHSTVIYAVNKINAVMKDKPEILDSYETIKRKLLN